MPSTFCTVDNLFVMESDPVFSESFDDSLYLLALDLIVLAEEEKTERDNRGAPWPCIWSSRRSTVSTFHWIALWETERKLWMLWYCCFVPPREILVFGYFEKSLPTKSGIYVQFNSLLYFDNRLQARTPLGYNYKIWFADFLEARIFDVIRTAGLCHEYPIYQVTNFVSNIFHLCVCSKDSVSAFKGLGSWILALREWFTSVYFCGYMFFIIAMWKKSNVKYPHW